MSSPLHKYEAPNDDFQETVLPKMCRQGELQNSEIRKNEKLGYFIVKANRPRDVP